MVVSLTPQTHSLRPRHIYKKPHFYSKERGQNFRPGNKTPGPRNTGAQTWDSTPSNKNQFQGNLAFIEAETRHTLRLLCCPPPASVSAPQSNVSQTIGPFKNKRGSHLFSTWEGLAGGPLRVAFNPQWLTEFPPSTFKWLNFTILYLQISYKRNNKSNKFLVGWLLHGANCHLSLDQRIVQGIFYHCFAAATRGCANVFCYKKVLKNPKNS